MKALILAAGYGTRLQQLAESKPKSLLEVGNKAVLEHLLENLKKVPAISEVFIVTNHRFHDQFRVWLNHYRFPKNIKLIDDGTLSNEDRLGAVGDLNYVLNEEEVDDDMLVIAGDNLFRFSLPQFVDFFKMKGKTIVAFHDLKETDKIRKKFGVGLLEGSRVVDFEEKPAKPRSTLASTACYLFSKSDLENVQKFIEFGKTDNPGDLIRFLAKESEVHGFVFTQPWFDIGSPESLEEARRAYTKK